MARYSLYFRTQVAERPKLVCSLTSVSHVIDTHHLLLVCSPSPPHRPPHRYLPVSHSRSTVRLSDKLKMDKVGLRFASVCIVHDYSVAQLNLNVRSISIIICEVNICFHM